MMAESFRRSRLHIADAEKLADQLEALLERAGINVQPRSELERICLAPTEILSYRSGQQISSKTVARQYADASALGELAGRLVRAEHHPSFQALLPHLSLLNQGDPSQLGRARATDHASRQVFELFVGLLAMDFSDSIELEHPRRTTPGNPDVVLNFRNRRWGLACKVPVSANPQSLADNLERAAEQIAESGVEVGLPFFNLKNVIPPESYWQRDLSDEQGERFVVAPEPESVPKQMLEDLRRTWSDVEDGVGRSAFAALFSPRSCVPAVLSYVQVLAPAAHGPRIGATSARAVGCYHVNGLEESAVELVHAFHRAATAPQSGETDDT